MQTAPYIKALQIDDSIAEESTWLHDLPVVQALRHTPLQLRAPVTFLMGENGSGKSTLLEGVAVACGFNPEGGTLNMNFATRESHAPLHRHLRAVRTPARPKDGFFLRAESMYNVASEVDRLGSEAVPGPDLLQWYGGVSLHEQSHGESFMALMQNRFGGRGLYILDEPEAALSPTRQLALLALLDRLVQEDSQFIIATHSVILPAYPRAEIYELGVHGFAPVRYDETEHYRITRRFLEAPQTMLRMLLDEE